jgi:hypothetical protein
MNKILSKIPRITLHLAIVLLLVAPVAVFAAEGSEQAVTFQPLTQLPAIRDAASANSLPVFLNQLYKICIGVGTVLAFFMIVRAGLEIMVNKGSVSTNEKAKSHLQGAILGLILLLSPYVVFSLINPDILKLSLDFGELQSIKNLDQVKVAATTGDTDQTQQCQAYDSITAVGNGKSCNLQNGYVSIPSSCCSSDTPSGKCCAVPKDVNSYQWEWRWAVVKNDENHSGRHTETAGPFKTQSECYASESNWTKNNPDYVFLEEGMQCNCDKPRSEYPACKAN